MNLPHWTLLVGFAGVACLAASHALLNKRDPRAALGWIALCLLFPFVGPFLYFLLGINRVRTRAQKLHPSPASRSDLTGQPPQDGALAHIYSHHLPSEAAQIARISDVLLGQPLLGGNQITMLHNGEQAYPVMLAAIEEARHHLFLTTYIFEANATGKQFVAALERAARRGVDVRIIIDGIGGLYSLPWATRRLHKCGVPVARFLPPKLWPPAIHINLRNHRKILVADGHTAFTGGMNIGDRHLADNTRNPSRVADTHFCLKGPIVKQIEQTFLEDWGFVTGDYTAPPVSTSAGTPGQSICRAIIDGPNEELDPMAMILAGAISCAHRRVSIMTPYFLPSRELISAIQTAALRGVQVSVVLPARNNLPYVQWAATNIFKELLQRGVRIYYQPGPFVHSKLFLVDEHYVQIGSANIDPRSLRLNFELMVEVYDQPFAETVAAHFDHVISGSRPVSLEDVAGRSLPIRIRDALCWLFSPYL